VAVPKIDSIRAESDARIDAAIGNTPMVRLTRVVEPGMADVWVKIEGMNPGGSIKDRTALGMIVDAERSGALKPGQMIVEPTSGNTGIGLAQVAAARGYPLTLCLPAQMSEERKRTLRAYGARLVLTDPERRMLAAIEEAQRIREATGACEARNALPGLEVRHAFANRRDDPRVFRTRNERRRRLELVLVLDDQDVGEVQARGLDLDEHFTRLGLRRRQFLPLDRIEAGGVFAQPGMHVALRFRLKRKS